MKILFVTHDRTAAQLGAQTLHGIAPNGTFTWTPTPKSALRWLQANRDAGAVIIEAKPPSPDGSSFVEQVRALGLTTRVVVIPPAGLAAWLTGSGANPFVPQPSTVDHTAAADRRSAVPDRPVPIAQTTERQTDVHQRCASELAAVQARLADQDAKHRALQTRAERLTVDLQRRLLELEAALDESQQTQTVDTHAAAERLARREAELAAALKGAAASRIALEQRLTEATAAVEQVRHRAAADSADAARREAALKAELVAAATARGRMEETLASAQSVRGDAERLHAADLADARARLADLQRRYEVVLADHATARVGLEQQLADAVALTQKLASEAADAAARHAALEERLAQETAARETLKRSLAAATIAHADADRRHGMKLAAASARLTDLQTAQDATLTEHAAARAAFEQKLADAAALTQKLASETTDAAARQAALEDRLAQEATAREALERNLAATNIAHVDAERRSATQLSDASTRLADLQNSYDATLSEYAAARAAFDRQLADATAVRDKLVSQAEAAAARQATLEERLARQTAAAEALEQNFVSVRAARVEADRRHATALSDASARLADLRKAYDAALTEHATARAAFGQQLTAAATAREELVSQADAAAARQAALEERLTQQTAAAEALEQHLVAVQAALAEADRRHATELTDVSARFADLQKTHDAALTEHADARAAFGQQLTAAAATRAELVSQADAAAARLADLQKTHDAALSEHADARAAFGQQLTDAAAARAELVSQADAAAARLADLQKTYDTALTEHADARAAFGQQLTDAADARAELVAEADAAAWRQATLEERLAQQTAAYEVLEQNLVAVEAARIDADCRHATELSDASARLADLQKAYDAALDEHSTARAAFEQQLADAAAARQELVSEITATTARQTAFEDRLAQATDACEALEQSLATLEAARVEEASRHATQLAEAAARLADLQTRYDGVLKEHGAARIALEQQLARAADAIQGLVSEAAAAAERQDALEDRLAHETSAREAVEQSFAAAESARADADRDHAMELAQASVRLADLQHAYDAALAEHTAARTALEQQLTIAAAELDTAERVRRTLESDLVQGRTNADRDRRRLLNLATAQRRRTRARIAELERQLHSERTDAGGVLAEKNEEIRALDAERQEYERARVASEAELRQLQEEHTQARHSLDHLGVSFVALERVAGENAQERARLESVVADRDAHLRAHVDRQAAAERAAAAAIETLRQELAATRARAAGLQKEAERTPVLQKQLDESQKEGRRLFERAPYGLCRFMKDGAFIQANHSFARMLGYRKVEEIRSVGLGTLFECPADLRWVIERAADTAATQTIETTLKTKKRRSMEVRLHALNHADGTIDVAVQDITAVRALEARLREAQRMEAVGRLASEVAVTCDMVLRDVTHGGRQWLAAIDSHPELRHQGELLLGEVTRAAGFLRQFSVYGKKQVDAAAQVSVQQVIRDLAPVLKRVAGDDIEWVLPKVSAPVHVDVDAERVERVLVNVASYARERMAHGGRIKIDVATTVLGHDFIAKYPNVRPGAHALITIAEMTGGHTSAAVTRPASDPTGVDLGALLALLGDCGGHVWIAAERSGNMTLKIHLPRRLAHDAADAAEPVTRKQRVRQLAGWFRH